MSQRYVSMVLFLPAVLALERRLQNTSAGAPTDPALLDNASVPDATAHGFENATAQPEARRRDKCMKHLWPDVADACGDSDGYHGSCKVRVSKLASSYGGSCQEYCSTFGFACSGGSVPQSSETSADASGGCGDAAAEYLSCSQRTNAEDAVCSCRDPLDTFLWRGAEETCGSGRVRVSRASAATCADFCQQQGMQCSAAEVSRQDCSPSKNATCDDAIDESAGAVCQCSGGFDRAGAFSWPDKKELCGASVVLVGSKELRAAGGTCQHYCSSLQKRVPGFDLFFNCYGAWPSRGQGCAAFTQRATHNFLQTSWNDCKEEMKHDAVCACSFADF